MPWTACPSKSRAARRCRSVGESGCGKSTVGRAILRLVRYHRGSGGARWPAHRRSFAGSPAQMRRRVQVVFQDPFSSLNPRMRVRAILAEPIRNFGLAKSSAELEAKVASLMDTVRLPRDALNRRPHEFSGGQRQRICIARALAAEPELDRLRRGGLGARRLGQGADRQPAAGSAAANSASRCCSSAMTLRSSST